MAVTSLEKPQMALQLQVMGTGIELHIFAEIFWTGGFLQPHSQLCSISENSLQVESSVGVVFLVVILTRIVPLRILQLFGCNIFVKIT